uniref:Uncharacterized protein n=1 Tax=Ditylenchus dipsaci TaxID=166011 RepID=A0A915DQG9_9BILA
MLSRALILPRLCSSLVVRRSFQTSSVASSGSEQWWNPEQANGREVVVMVHSTTKTTRIVKITGKRDGGLEEPQHG